VTASAAPPLGTRRRFDGHGGELRPRDCGRANSPIVARRSFRRRTEAALALTYACCVAELPIPKLVENRRRSVAMPPRGAPALNRDEALELLEAALVELRN
jgi:hypothetical protein